MRRALWLLLIAGCSSATSHPDIKAHDLAPPATDMTVPCTLTATGDVTMTFGCRAGLCTPTGSSFDDVYLVPASSAGPSADITIAPQAAVRSYGSGDLRSFEARVTSGSQSWEASKQLAGSSLTLTLTSVTPASSDPCSGSVHGAGEAMLVGVDPTTGLALGSGSVALAFTF